MITEDYVRTMARYGRWINEGIYGACDQLSDEDRKRDCGAFFKSIHATLNHLLWGDQMWMHRLAQTPAPPRDSIAGSQSQYESYEDLKRERAAFDLLIEDWAAKLEPASLQGDLTWYSSTAERDIIKPRCLLIAHMFNHQTHHRGQVHCMLTQFGVKTPIMDLPFMP